MSTQAIKEYLLLIWKQYKSASKAEKSVLINEVVKNLRMHRKAVIRLLNSPWAPHTRRGSKQEGIRRERYSQGAKEQLCDLWPKMGYMCGVRMKAALPEWLPFYEHRACTDGIRDELLKMSSSTITRYLSEERAKLRRKMNTGTRRGVRKFITQVPIRDLDVTPQSPGYCEVDCVAHCGDSLTGTFAWTLTLTDIATGWTECEALWGKDGYQARKALENIEARLPFKLCELYFDNGTEFMNEEVIERFATRNRRERLSIKRGRPRRKNDQCYVEQKNYTHVRSLFGYARIDWRLGVEVMNDIYRKEWSRLQNFYMPQQKLQSKYRLGAKVKRFMDSAQSPSERLALLKPELQRTLERDKASLNPFSLRHNQKVKVRKLNTDHRKATEFFTGGKMAL